EGGPNVVTVQVDGQLRSLSAAKPLAWQPGHIAAQAFASQIGAPLTVEDAGDFDKNQSFSYGAWVKLTKAGQSGSLLARMDDQHDYRGWDLWIENNRVAAHLVHKWDQDALKVVANTLLKMNQWYHVFITYDGSAKAAGLKIHVNGAPQQATPQPDRLQGTIRTTVPLKITQRNTGQGVEGALLQDLRVYNRTLTGLEVEQLAKTGRAAWLAAKPAHKRTAEETNELFDWWLATLDAPYQA